MSTRRFVSQSRSAILERILATLIVALAILTTSNNFAFSDKITTNGQTMGASSGESDNSTTASFGASSNSKALSFGSRTRGGSVAVVGAGVTQISSDGPNSVNVTSVSAAGASSDPNTMRARAIAAGNGLAGAIAGNGSIGAAAVSSPNGLGAYAAGSDGSYAAAATGQVTGVSSYVPNGTTQTITRRNGAVQISISVSNDGNYSIARLSPRGVSAAVGMNSSTTLAAGNIRQLVRMAFYAEARASYGGVSASASAEVNAAASNLAAQARAMGFSSATARVERTRSGSVVMTVTGDCDRSSWRNAKWKTCQPLRKVVKLGKSAKSSLNMNSSKRIYVRQAGYVIHKNQAVGLTQTSLKAAHKRKYLKN